LWSSIGFLSLAVAGVGWAGPPETYSYAGSIRTTPVDSSLSFSAETRVEGSGRRGRYVLEGLESWIWDFALTCPRPQDLPIRLVESGTVVTTQHGDQLLLESLGGRLCLEVLTSRFVGEQWGEIFGGTGRFEGATGSYTWQSVDHDDGTGSHSMAELEKLVRKHFDLTPKGIIDSLELLRPIYRATSYHGHFGREGEGFPWESTEKAEALANDA